ncbi:MAG: LysE family transporter [Paraprevotella sp.]|jgi:threonine/homoserine/homoserine lactone efflux protein|nr:LysE family transporter [Paraprevotella sp.]MBQ5379974.1 LysE family transporter [Paraprevotella sp.]MBR0361036.1 LysE family transporter [Paraprevotella sp.]
MWFESVSTLDLIIKGLLIGIVASAPMGPVGVLCIQRTLNKGRWFGFVTGIGAAFSDIIYALITGFGMSFVVDFIEDKDNMFYLQLIGSIMLFLFGLYTFRSNPTKSIRPTSPKKGTLVHNMVTGFFVTFSNPLIIFLFVALFARFTFVIPDHLFQQSIGYLSIALGALLWWFVLTYFIDKVRSKFNVKGIWILNRIIGSAVIIAAIIGIIITLTGLSF